MKRCTTLVASLFLFTFFARAYAEKVLYDFESDAETPAWRAENDGVMGGVSKGTGAIAKGVLIFEGHLSLKNNGGFASLQTKAGSWDLSKFKGVNLKVKGDGRTYQFRVATDARRRGSRIDYAAPFQTKKDEWIRVFVAFADMKPTWHGRNLKGPKLDLAKVEQLRILLADGQEGPFQLAVETVVATE